MIRSDSSAIKSNRPLSPRAIALGLLAGGLLFMAFGTTSCNGSRQSSSANAAGLAEMAGEYALVSVDGKSVPCTVSHEGHDVQVKSGKFMINPDGTCRSVSVFSVSQQRDINRIVDATYTRSGAEFTMRWKGAGMTKGTIEDNTFTMNNEGMIFLYRK